MTEIPLLEFSITESVIDIGHASAFLLDEKAGGVDIFLGVTRRWTKGKETEKLEYDCYQSMALKEIEALIQSAVAKWPIIRVNVHHRIGVVPAGEPSVFIGVATPHRADAFEACRFLIDTLKLTVPIWKKEVYSDGTTEWVDPTR